MTIPLIAGNVIGAIIVIGLMLVELLDQPPKPGRHHAEQASGTAAQRLRDETMAFDPTMVRRVKR